LLFLDLQLRQPIAEIQKLLPEDEALVDADVEVVARLFPYRVGEEVVAAGIGWPGRRPSRIDAKGECAFGIRPPPPSYGGGREGEGLKGNVRNT
jgi:hypothetical protein